MHGCDVSNKRGFDRPYLLSEHTLVIIGEQSELTVSSCQSRFVGRVCIGRNFEISLRRRGIVYGMRVHGAKMNGVRML